MDFLVPRNTTAESGKDPLASPLDRPTDTFPDIRNSSAVEFIQALALASGQSPSPEPQEPQSAATDTETGDEIIDDPVSGILETWSGITASLRTDPARPDNGDMILSRTTEPEQPEQMADRPAPPEIQKPGEIMSHIPAGADAGQSIDEREIIPQIPNSISAAENLGSLHTVEGGTVDVTGTSPEPDGGSSRNRAMLMPPDAGTAVIADQGQVQQARIQTEPEAPATAKRKDPAPHNTVTSLPANDSGFNERAASAVGQKAAQSASGISEPFAPLSASGPHALQQGTVQPVEIRAPTLAAAPVLRQITDAVVTMRDEMVEIRLSPEELGRVRMVLTGHDRVPHLTIWAERPEVLEQMRRNADMLLQQFSKEGLSDAVLNFREGRRDQAGGNTGQEWQADSDDRNQQGMAILTDMDQTAPASPTRIGANRIDIRM
ncbi:flagellar hook-length control protein FliK [Paracoccus alkanivorans]|nr:flagellar hook-length control protein FliK [Paracoccus alkanivorans]